jgi:alpha-2-macroglobulin
VTLPKRLVSLLLIYSFVLAIAPSRISASTSDLRVPASSESEVSLNRFTDGLLAPFRLTHDFFSSILSTSNVEDEDKDTDEKGLTFRLSEAPEQPDARPANKLADATVLSEAETKALISRLPDIKTDATDETDFALRDKSLPPPRTGLTVLQPFPAASELTRPDQRSPGPLDVVRFSPEGEVPIAPNLSITFSQPMVAMTSQEDAARTVPVKLSPQPPGKWHWIGTKTLLFEPDGRFPMATQYRVTVPAGTKSAAGANLAQTKTWSFATPAPTVKNFIPGTASTQRRDVLMFAEFDQRIEPSVILKHVRLTGAADRVNLRLASAEEIAANEEIQRLVKNAQPDRWIAFRATDANGRTENALPAGSRITVSFDAGTPSAEGTRTTTAVQTFSFATFGDFRMVNSGCGWDLKQPCTPGTYWQIEFTNPPDAQTLQDSQVRVTPALNGLKVSAAGNRLTIQGNPEPDSIYRVTIDKSLRDQFDQTLGKDVTVEFKVGARAPWIGLSSQGFVVLDPASQRRISLYSVNYKTVKVSLYAVQPEDWSKFQTYRRLRYQNQNNSQKAPVPGRLVLSRLIDLQQSRNQMLETPVDLRPALKNDFGQVLVVIDSITPSSDRYHNPLFAWVQSTQIGLDAFLDNDEVIGWANSLSDGSPLAGVQMQILPAKISGTTGADGLAHLSLKPASESTESVLIARRGDDVAILPEGPDNWWSPNGSWFHKPSPDQLRWYVFDDRNLYRPGEEVHVKGWMRRVGSGKTGDVGPLEGAVTRVNYILKDSQDNDVTKGELTPDAFGGFDLKLKLPPNMNLGNAELRFDTTGESRSFPGQEFTHAFQVQEFRRPEFEVTAKVETDGPLFIGDHADVNVAARYFAGGGLANAEVKWQVYSSPTNFTPPNRDDFIFGKWIPWWESSNDYDANNEEGLTGRTDAGGNHRLRIDFDSVKPARPSSVRIEATVQDVNRQSWTNSASLLVHPANLYVGLKSEKTFVQQGEPLIVQSIVTDLDGRSMANRQITMRAVLLDWKQVKGEWKQVAVNPQDCTIRSAADPVKCTFTPKEGGTYRVRATITDDKGRANETEMMLWVAGGKRPASDKAEEGKVQLIPDRKEYKPGDTAQILVQAPFFPAQAVMTLQRSGIVKTETFRLDSPTYTLRVPIEEGWIPNIHVQVDIAGAEDRGPAGPGDVVASRSGGARTTPLPPRPAFATGEINLSIPPLSRRLKVVATPRDKTLEPAATTVIDVEAKDANDKAVSNSDVAVVVVDESVLALTNYRLSDPVSFFYSERSAEVSFYRSRRNMVLAKPAELVDQFNDMSVNASRQMAMSETVTVTAGLRAPAEYGATGLFTVYPAPKAVVDGADQSPLQLRQNFNALAVFVPSVPTDASGRAQVQVKLPDNLTRYRVMAVAVDRTRQFGAGESTITARLPLMARPSAPRFLNFGDRFELPIVLQNQTDSAMTVNVGVRARNASFGSGGEAVGTTAYPTAGRRVTVPANDRVEVRIPASAIKAGTARFQIAAASGKWTDAAEVELPVWTPATSEAFATYGEIDRGAINQPVKAPPDVFPQFGGLEIETSSTQLQQLTDAVIYLTSYPYECSEQLASRIITVAALRDVLTAFKAKDLPSPAEMEAAVTRDLKRLQGMQNDDGGFGFWQRGNESWPYLSIHVAHALARARQKKFEVPKEMFDKSQKYLREIDSHIPASYGIDARRAIIAYALYVRAQMSDRDPVRARKLIAEAGLEKLSLESVGWLLSLLSTDKASTAEVAAIRHLLNNRVTETAGTAHFVCSYSDDDYLILNSNRRADGVILEALIGDQPNNDLIPKIVRGLLAHRTRGRWENTQENVFILLALDRYFNTFEKVTPNFVARAWLGERFAGEQQFQGRSTDRQQINVPMRYLTEVGTTQDLLISKEGAGRLYYRIGLNYAPRDLNLKPADYGFTVERSYEAIDNPADVSRDKDGTWHIKAGARVRVRLSMVAVARRYHVALVDPLPAGFEALNPSLVTTGTLPRDDKQTGVITEGSRSFGYGWWWWRPEWFEHQNLRDNRVEAFTSLLWEGVYKYSYVARATTPGAFVVPPAKAEEMYHPETFGRGKTDRVKIE